MASQTLNISIETFPPTNVSRATLLAMNAFCLTLTLPMAAYQVPVSQPSLFAMTTASVSPLVVFPHRCASVHKYFIIAAENSQKR